METWHPSLETFFIGYRFGGVGKNRHSFCVVNVKKRKKQVKQMKMFCFAEIFLHIFMTPKYFWML